MRRRGVARLLVIGLLWAAPAAAASPGPSLSVDAGAGQHAISPYIYGWNYAPADFAKQIDLPVDRRGGNAADTLNWQTGFENHSQDYFFENIPDAPAGQPQRAYTDQIDADRAAKAKTLIDLPMLGYVPRPESPADHPYDCSYPKTVFDETVQYSFDPYDPNCGDGRKKSNKDQWFTNTAQLSTAVADPPEHEGGWIDDLKSRYGDAAGGGVAFYELGNEPALWSDTHHDWHPAPVTFDELWNKSLALAQVVKAHDPTAAVLAFSEWGWPNYFCSAYDNTNDGCDALDNDRINHDGMELAAWLLKQFKDWSDAHAGQRLIDYFDLHYYRQDDGTPGFDATRSLWDPTYTDQSWINDKIRLLPRMHDWVDQNYPGTKISLSEYDMSFGDTTDDNLVEADTLGIFAREQLDMATLFRLKDDVNHYEDAFRLFRNYDGQHSEFGDTYVSSQSADQGKLSVYGARRSTDGALTLVVVNKSQTDLTSSIGLAGFSPGPAAQVFSWSGVAGGITRAADQAVDSNGFSATFPARSMTMVAIPAAGAPLQTGTGNPPPPVGSTTTPPHSSAGRCVVPKLKGLTLKKAKAKLKKAHCRLGKVTKKRSRVRKGRVIGQKPKARSVRKKGARVGVVLSRGR